MKGSAVNRSLQPQRARSLLPAVAGALLLVLCAAPVLAQNAKPGAAPSRSGHTAAVTRVAIDAGDRFLVTGSEDKTVRVWDLANGRLLKILKPGAAAADSGKVYAVAMSPDGKHVAVSGYTGQKNPRIEEERTYHDYEIYIYDWRRGKLLRTLEVAAFVDGLAWSAAGDFLIATSSSAPYFRFDLWPETGGVTIFRTSDYAPVAAVTGNIYALAARAPAGRLVVIGKPGGMYGVQTFSAAFAPEEEREFPGVPAALTISPDGTKFAVVDALDGVGVYSADDLSLLYEPVAVAGKDTAAGASATGSAAATANATTSAKAEAGAVASEIEVPPSAAVDTPAALAWADDGTLYFSAGSTCRAEGCFVRKWPDEGRGPASEILASSFPVTHLAALHGGGVAFGTTGPAFGVIGADARRLYVEGEEPRQPARRVAAESTDGRVLGQCFSWGGGWREGRQAYIDKTGRVVLAPPFASVWAFSEGRAGVARDQKKGFIDHSGKLVVPARFDVPTGEFSEGRAFVLVGELYGYIDRQGKLVIRPQFEAVGRFSGGLAAVQKSGQSRLGFINANGEVVVPAKFDLADEFHEGLAAVRLGDQWGYIDTTGRWVIDPAFEEAERFSEGLAFVRRGPCTERPCTHSVIDRTGRVVAQGLLHTRDSAYSEGLALIRDREYRNGFVDKGGNVVVPLMFADAQRFSDGLAAVANAQKKWGYIDRQGSLIIPFRYDEADSFSEGLAAVAQGGQWGYIDKTGRMVVEPRFTNAARFAEGLADVCIDAQALAKFEFPGPRAAGVVGEPPAHEVAPAIIAPSPDALRLSDAERERLTGLRKTTLELVAARRYGAALPAAQDALRLVELRLTARDATLIEPLLDLARIYRALGNYRDAVGEWPSQIGEYDRARSLYQRARALLPEGGEAATSVLDELADLQAEMGRFDEARDTKRKVLAALTARHGATHRDVLETANDFEAFRVAKELWPEFGKKLIKVFPIAQANLQSAEQGLGAQHPNVARALMHVAIIYDSLRGGFRRTSIEFHQRALTMRQQLLGADHWEVVTSQSLLAEIHDATGNRGAADAAHQAVFATMEKVFGPEDPAVLRLVSERAVRLRDRGEYRQAEQQFLRALAYWEKDLAQSGARHSIVEVRHALEGLGDTYRYLGEYLNAATMYQRYIDSKDQLIAINQYPLARVTSKLATAQRLAGKAAQARTSSAAAFALVEKDLPPAGTTGWHLADAMSKAVFEDLALVELAGGNARGALDLLTRAVASEERTFRTLLSFPQEERSLELLANPRVMHYHDLTLALVADHLAADPQAVRSAFDLAVNRKGITLDLHAHARRLNGTLPEAARQAADELGRVHGELTNLMLRRPPGDSDAQYENKLALLFERRGELESTIAYSVELAASRPDVGSVNAARVAAALPADAVFVDFLRLPRFDYRRLDLDRPAAAGEAQHRYVAFVLTAARDVAVIDLGAADKVDDLVEEMQRHLRGFTTPAAIGAVLKDLHALIWQPLRARLGSARRVIVSPDGALNRVSFAALIEPGGEFLIRRHQFAYVGAGRDLVQVPLDRAAPELDLLLVADPEFGADTGGDYFAELPGTAQEAQMIPPLVRGTGEKLVLTRAAASEAAVKRARRARIVHLATHGVFDAEQSFGWEGARYENALVRSRLAFAGANRAPGSTSGEDDGLLTALEVTGMDLSATDLAVLSVCDAGAGEAQRGQGILGLRRAFALAGAQNLLLTLWPVDDAVTAELMLAFYQEMQAHRPVQALHNAQVRVLQGLSAKGFANPRLWAPFILQSAQPFVAGK